MRARMHVTLAGAVLGLAALACRGECAGVAALLDFAAIIGSGGVPSPPSERR